MMCWVMEKARGGAGRKGVCVCSRLRVASIIAALHMLQAL
jgi:hypothetical protein